MTIVADRIRHQPGRSLASLATGGVPHQQAQELAALLDDAHVRDAGFVAGVACSRSAMTSHTASNGAAMRHCPPRRPRRADGGPDWFRVLDVDDRIYAARYSLADPTLAPPGHELLQISAACAPGERKADAERRAQHLLDESWPGRRAAVRGRDLTVATDQSAAPGLLAEVGISAAQLALQHLDEASTSTGARVRA
ncbi:hypothetical protein ACFPOI_26125 [Nonomuraea angiospora]|uniref:Uncharacterized protein n=1 Tax=Nonomuraea angiospora TaxID=46172 RepID=A0ABR9LPL3_9ACTN|nr:hypothetical protein [Nonomuraea angiospora]MBE1582360.1 hypothetical protein [Nonomuraea angiospora]